MILRRQCLLVLAAMLVCAAVRAQSANPQVEAAFRQGAEAMRAGNAAAAEDAFRKVTQLAPDMAEAFLDLGLAQIKQGKLPDAAASLKKALELNPEAPGAHMFLGIADYQMNRTDDAIANLHQETQMNPKSAEAWTWLGIVELSSGHPENATAPLDRAAELAPNDPNVLDYRGRAHLLVSKASYAQLYKLDPGSWRVHRLNAEIAAEAEQHKQAIDEFNAAIKLAPGQPDLYEELGEEYRKAGSADLAEKAFEQELELTPNNPVAMYNLGSVRVDRGEEQTGVPLLENVSKLYGKPTVADYYLGRGLAAEGKNDEAAAALLRATDVPGEVQRRAWYELAQTYRKMGQTAKAHEALVKYQALRQAAGRENAKQVEDWRKLNAGTDTEASATPQK